MLKFKWWVFLLLAAPPLTVNAGWLFGPSDADDCVDQYAPKAQTKRLVGATYAQCRIAFDKSAHQIQRDRALCVAEEIPSLKTEYALGAIFKRCEAKYPTPHCSTGTAFAISNDRCERICDSDEGQRTDFTGERCEMACPPSNRLIGNMCYPKLY